MRFLVEVWMWPPLFGYPVYKLGAITRGLALSVSPQLRRGPARFLRWPISQYVCVASAYGRPHNLCTLMFCFHYGVDVDMHNTRLV